MIYLTLTNQLTMLKYNLRMTATEIGIYQDDTFKTAFLNMGQKSFIRDTKALGGNLDVSLTTVLNQSEYDLWTITNFLCLDPDWKILVDGRETKFKSIKQMYAEFGSTWQSATAGNPQVCYLRCKRYLGLYQKPSADYASKIITVPYVKRPADMSAVSDTPFDSNPYLEEFTEAPVMWASWKLLWRAKQYAEASGMKTLYQEMVNKCIAEINSDEPEKNYFKPSVYNSQR
jgi:hypothetical protein